MYPLFLTYKRVDGIIFIMLLNPILNYQLFQVEDNGKVGVEE